MGIALATTRPHHQVTIVQTVLFYGIKGHPFVLNGRGGYWTKAGRGWGEVTGQPVRVSSLCVTSLRFFAVRFAASVRRLT